MEESIFLNVEARTQLSSDEARVITNGEPPSALLLPPPRQGRLTETRSMLELVKAPSAEAWKVLTLPRLCAARAGLRGADFPAGVC